MPENLSLEELEEIAAPLADVPRVQSYIDYVGAEIGADSMFSYTTMVPGPLQTPDVAEACKKAYSPDATPEEVAAIVALRRRRGESAIPPRTFYVHKNALVARPSPDVNWREQLRHLAEVNDGPHTVQLVPADEDRLVTATDMVSLAEGGPQGPAAYFENARQGHDHATRGDPRIEKVRRMFAELGNIALSPNASTQVIRRHLAALL